MRIGSNGKVLKFANGRHSLCNISDNYVVKIFGGKSTDNKSTALRRINKEIHMQIIAHLKLEIEKIGNTEIQVLFSFNQENIS